MTLEIHSANIQDTPPPPCNEGVGHGERCAAVGFEVRSGVEAEPADPEQRGADHGHGQRVRSHQLLAVAGPLADQQRTDETGDAGVDVHHGAAAKSIAPFLKIQPASALTSSSLACAAVFAAASPAALAP
jgi:hypothetical protein